LSTFRHFIKTIPEWAFVCVLIVLFVQSANMFYNARMPVSGERENYDNENGYWIIDFVDPDGPVDKAGINIGDTIVSCNGYSLEEWLSTDHDQRAGDTLIFGILKYGQEIEFPVVITSRLSMATGFYWSAFFIIILVSVGSLFVLYKKPRDKAVKLFFLYIQQFAVLEIGAYWPGPEPELFIVIIAFHTAITILGPTLIHFHLVFPEPVRILNRYRKLPALFYIIGLSLFILNIINIISQLYFGVNEGIFNFDFIAAGFLWLSITSAIALIIAIFRFVSIRDTLTRNQLRIVVIGSFFGLITPMMMVTFSDYLGNLWNIYPNLIQIWQGTGSLIMICCLLIAIFRFRIWNIEVVLKKALLYLGATAIIICTYLLLLYIVDLMIIDETNVTRFVTLSVSVMIFLISRDKLQNIIEKVFHRESYDSATVVSEFEEKLAGVYRMEELGSGIIKGMDEIFHLKYFILFLRKEGMRFEPAFIHGSGNGETREEVEISQEMMRKLTNSTVFSPAELSQIPKDLESIYGELIVPMVKDLEPVGFLLCGPKKSEKTYSLQDIRVLSIIAKRIIALFQTAVLYQKELDRQLALERERARIAQDMHDDIGAGLTKIAMMSERVNSEKRIVNNDQETETRNPEPGTWNLEPGTRNPEPGTWNSGTKERERMQKVATTAREMINRLNVIVWALNPRYDNLDSLISYARRYFGEYLENSGINFKMEVNGEIPDLPVTPDFRRNAFYAWQEAIHNSVKHSACIEISFIINISGHSMRVTITDNGKGFDQAKPGSGGNGLLNMRKRAEELGGMFEIHSEVGKGTKISFDLELLND
jgi:signal transduction histidine kinase